VQPTLLNAMPRGLRGDELWTVQRNGYPASDQSKSPDDKVLPWRRRKSLVFCINQHECPPAGMLAATRRKELGTGEV